MTYLLKKELKDFQVEEILKQDLISEKPTNILLYLLTKINYTTERAVQQIARSLRRIPRKNIGYAGAKDKNAITKQYISITRVSKEKIDNLDLKDIKLEPVGFASKQLRLGDLEGNKFRIRLRNLSETELISQETFLVPNYFDEQRFSTKNIELGLAITRGAYKDAINILLENDKDYKEPIKKYLETHLNDYVGALKLIPRKILLFYMHSIQSKLFNDELVEQIRLEHELVSDLEFDFGILRFPKKLIKFDENKLSETTKLLGWDSENTSSLEKMNLRPRSFLIKSMPELSLNESERPSYSLVKDFKMIKIQDKDSNEDSDEINEEKDYLVEFTLGKGSYATIVLKQLFGKEN